MSEFITVANQFGLSIAILLGILVTGAAGVWVWGWQFKKLEKDNERLSALVEKGQVSAERLAELLERRGAPR